MSSAILDAIVTEYLKSVEAGGSPDPQPWIAKYPDLAAELRAFFDQHARLQGLAERLAQDVTVAPEVGREVPTLRYVGDYELLSEIARGGMGVVFRARQTSLGREVAVKMMLAGTLAGQGDLARFRTEAEAAAGLDHPNILPLYEVGQHEGLPFFSMKLVTGGSLAQIMPELQGDAKRAARLLALVARAVHHAHQRGVLHRDLKPANILLDRSTGVSPVTAATGETPVLRETPYVSDFGLARRGSDKGQTQTGQVLGTPSYMAPEQARAEKSLTVAVDVYALGTMLYECLTGRPPFRTDSVFDTIMQVIEKEPPHPRNLATRADLDLSVIALKCLSKEPARRYGSAAEVADELERWLDGEPILARPVGRVTKAWRWVRRNPVVTALSGMIVAALLCVVALALVIAARSRETAQRDRDRLFDSLVSQAQAERRGGNRQRALELLAEAATMRRSDLLCKEAIGALSTSGVRFLKDLETGEADNKDRPAFGPVFTSDDTLVAYTGQEMVWGEEIRDPDGSVGRGGFPKGVLHVREIQSGKLLAKHADLITPLRFRPRTRHLAIAKVEKSPTTTLWDPISGKDLGTYPGHHPMFSEDGDFLATVAGKQVRIWDLTRSEEMKPPQRGKPLRFLSERELLLLEEQSYYRWDFTLGQQTAATPKGTRGLGVSVDGRLAALYGKNAAQPKDSVLLWNLLEGKLIDTLPDLGFVPVSVSFSADSKQLAIEDSSEKRMTIAIWDVAARSVISRLSSRGVEPSRGSWASSHSWGYPLPSFSPDGAFIVARGIRGRGYVLCVWDIETGAEVIALPNITYFWWREGGRTLLTMGAKKREGYPFSGTGNPDGSITIGEAGRSVPVPPSGHLKLWEVSHSTPTYLLDSDIRTASFNVDGSRLAVNDLVWDVNKQGERHSLRRTDIAAQGLTIMLCGRDEVWGASLKAEGDTYATLYQLAPMKRKFSLQRPASEIEKQVREGKLQPNGDLRARHIALSPDAQVALVASNWYFFGNNDHRSAMPLDCWDLSESRLLKRWNQESYTNPEDPNGKEWMAMQFSPTGKRVATSNRSGVTIWDVTRGEVERTLTEVSALRPGVSSLKAHQLGSSINQLSFSRDGSRILAVAPWIQGGSYTTTNGKITRDTRTEGWAGVFEVETGDEIRTWEAPLAQGGWKVATLSPDGQLVASWSEDRLIRLHEVATSRVLAHWEAHESDVTVLAFHPDGNTLLSGSKDGMLTLWNLPYIRGELAKLGLDW